MLRGKLIIFFVVLLILLAAPGSALAASQLPADSPWSFARPAVRTEKDNINARAYYVFDPASNEAVLAQDEDRRLYPASTTKIMTAIITLETLPLDQMVKTSEQAVALGANSSKVGLVSGETVMVRDLLAGLMVASGNDAANVLAEAIAGSNEAFAWRMNKKAQELKLENSYFCNPSGLHDDAHLSSARDLAVLTAYAMENEYFRQLASLASYAMPATDKHPFLGWALLSSTNRFLHFGDTAFASPYIKSYSGVKTGSTNFAGNCLVSAAVLIDGRELICVVLGSDNRQEPNSLYCDSLWLFEKAAQELGLDPQGLESSLVTEKPPEPTPAPPTPAPTPSPSPAVATPTPAASLAPLSPAASEPDWPDQLEPSPGQQYLALLQQYWPGILFGAGVAGLILLSSWLLIQQSKRKRRRRQQKVRPRRL